MGTTSPKAVIMDETAVNRAMTRIAHEILERTSRAISTASPPCVFSKPCFLTQELKPL